MKEETCACARGAEVMKWDNNKYKSIPVPR